MQNAGDDVKHVLLYVRRQTHHRHRVLQTHTQTRSFATHVARSVVSLCVYSCMSDETHYSHRVLTTTRIQSDY